MKLTALPHAEGCCMEKIGLLSEKYRKSLSLLFCFWAINDCWLGTVWNWTPNTIMVKTEMKLKLRTKFHLHWSRGLSTTVECQTLVQLVPTPWCISVKIVHLSRCRLSIFWVSCSHSLLQWMLRALSKWSRKKLAHKTWTWSTDASEAHQPTDYLGQPNLKTQKTV